MILGRARKLQIAKNKLQANSKLQIGNIKVNMEEQVPVEQIKEIKANPIWVTVVIAIIVAVVVGSVVCLVQSYKFSNLESKISVEATIN